MAAGRCTAIVRVGTIEIPCPCTEGIFTIAPLSTLEVTCKKCSHLLSDHQDTQTDPSPTENLTPVSNYEEREVCDDPITCPRKDTVSKLATAVDSEIVIHVRGTPASGKTTLSLLLKDYYLKNNRKVFLIDVWKPLENFHGKNAWDNFALSLQQRYPKHSSKDFFASKTVIIIDEAQASYTDEAFWNTIIKKRRSNEGKDIRLCLFCSYGNPLTGLDTNYLRFTPVTFGPAQRITLTPQPQKGSPQIGLFYTRDEFNEAVSRLATHNYQEMFALDEEAQSYIFTVTNGHPGGVKSILSFVFDVHRHDLKHRHVSIITKDHVVHNLEDDAQVFRYLANQAIFRSFPEGRHLTPEAARTLSKILEGGNAQFDSEDVGMLKCYERGWVHRTCVGEFKTSDMVVLPSRLHEKWVEFIIGEDRRSLPTRFNKLDNLCMEVLREFSTMNLRHAAQGKKMSTAARCRPMEAQYQDEFYRAFNFLVGRGVPICSEWSRTSDGRVDFWIPEKKWAIELLRDHDRIDEHISRFKQGGKYYSWLQDKMIEDWIIIDCATSWPTNAYSEPKLWHAVFTNDYTELKVYDHQKKPLIDVRLKNQVRVDNLL